MWRQMPSTSWSKSWYWSTATISAASNLQRIQTEHIEVNYIGEWILSGDIGLQYIGTNENMADIFTNALAFDKLRQFSEVQRRVMRLRPGNRRTISTRDEKKRKSETGINKVSPAHPIQLNPTSWGKTFQSQNCEVRDKPGRESGPMTR